MKALKIIGGVIGVLLLAYLVLAATGPERMETSRSTEIAAPASLVYQQIYELKNWENWLPWSEDPTMKIEFGEQTSGVGASYTWTSEDSGDGSLKIIEATPNQSLKTELQFGNWGGVSNGIWALSETDGVTKVVWGMEGSEVPFFFRGIMALMGMEKRMEADFDKGLASLKNHVETMKETAPAFSIRIEEQPAKYFAAIRDEILMEAMQDFYAQSYGAIGVALESSDLQVTGMPCGLYYTWDQAAGKTDMAAAMPVSGTADLGATVNVIEIPAGKAAVLDYYGNYDGLGAAHEAMDTYLTENKLEAKMPVMEEYVTDPGTESDPAKWLTRIYYYTK